MKVTVEISMYPLRSDYQDQVLSFLDKISKFSGLTIRVNALSTQIQGDIDVVMDAVKDSIAQTFSKEIRASFVMKILPGNIDLNYVYTA